MVILSSDEAEKFVRFRVVTFSHHPKIKNHKPKSPILSIKHHKNVSSWTRNAEDKKSRFMFSNFIGNICFFHHLRYLFICSPKLLLMPPLFYFFRLRLSHKCFATCIEI